MTTVDVLANTIMDAYDSGAGIPARHRVTGSPVEMPGGILELDKATAYDLQAQCVADLCARWGVEPAGFKISVTNTADQQRIGATEPTFGRLTSRHLLESGAEIELADENAPLLEPELLMRTTRELGAGTTEGDVSDSVEVAGGIEVPVCRFCDWFPEGQEPLLNVPALISDNSVAGYVVVGQPWRRPDGLVWDDVSVTVYHDDDVVIEGNSSAVLGNPLRSVVWLANKLADRGESIPAGAVLSTGTFTVPVRPGVGRYRAVYGRDVGDVSVTFR